MSFWDELHSAVGGSPSPPQPTPQPPLYATPGPPGPPYAYLSPPQASMVPNPGGGTLPPQAMVPMEPQLPSTIPGRMSGLAGDAAKQDGLRLQADLSVLTDLDGNLQQLTSHIAAAKATTTKELQDLEPKYQAAVHAVEKPNNAASLMTNLSQLASVIGRLQEIWNEQLLYSKILRNEAVQLSQQYNSVGTPGAPPSPAPPVPAPLQPLLNDPSPGTLLEGNASEYGNLLNPG